MVEYNALFIGLDITKQLRVKHLEVYGDSQLIVNQIKGEYEVRNEDLIPYYTATTTLANSFECFYIDYLPRLRNTYDNALASLAAILALPEGATQQVIVVSRQLFRPKYALQINAIDKAPEPLEPRDWQFLIINYVFYCSLPKDIRERKSVRRRALRFYYNSQSQTLYRRSYDGLLLHCLSSKEALKEAHGDICGAHQLSPKLWD
ncbi:uncharacterized protein LOC109823364 [Asparagus officinalis]|uniref:uncharacterized protein LOC109823364 n=1 Tax=Asparagus officinalis TaxID=4686 RepID=UPI00098E5C94|nr:uncharacterized protein LOC109823364 [Asparagus officinalis]